MEAPQVPQNEAFSNIALPHFIQNLCVCWVPGKFFFPKPITGLGTMRLNFTNISQTEIIKAIKLLSEIIIEETANLELAV